MVMQPPFMKGRRVRILLELGALKLKEKYVGLSEIERTRMNKLMKELMIKY